MTEYPIVQIPIQDLDYKRNSPAFQSLYGCSEKYLKWFSLMEKELPNITRPIERMCGYGIAAIEELYQVYMSLKTTKKMWNPLILLKDYDRMFVTRGQQRLCALRALGYTGKVPCRMDTTDGSQWRDDSEPWAAHPYTEVDYKVF